MATNVPVTPDTLITIKVQVGGENRRIKLPLRELGPQVLPTKLRSFLAVPEASKVIYERYSDSAGSFIQLDSNNPQVYKQLYRAAKAKLKLRIKATVLDAPEQHKAELADLSPRLSSSPTTTLESPRAVPTVREALYNLVDANPYLLSNLSGATLKPITEQKKTESFPLIKKEEESLEKSGASDLLRSSTASDTTPLVALTPKCPMSSFTIHCNNCNKFIPNAHWHCSICRDGDFDLCQKCVDTGNHCDVDSHFMIRRLIENGTIINSTRESVARKPIKVESEKAISMPFKLDLKEEILPEYPETLEMSRTCNSCVNVFEESNFVSCLQCEDYDLCIPCHVGLKHGHHPSHTFVPVSPAANLNSIATSLCAPGRNVRHYAICDGCDKTIYGVRHKCFSCPDWDYCSTCFKNARQTHPGHRFAPIYETMTGSHARQPMHYNILCDGPLCKNNKHYIRGDRYKCAVCHDTDFCANCEALPSNPHNRTHPVIKFRTPVRKISCTTFGENGQGESLPTMGDRVTRTSSKSTETTPAAPSANAATQVHTVVDVKPVEKIIEKTESEKAQISPPQLDAHFVRDTVPDGSKLPPGKVFQQKWIMRNPGPLSWPAGCGVWYIGGDIMLNMDTTRPSSISDIDVAIHGTVIDRPVAPGEEVAFLTHLKTPQRPGKAISYWRLKTREGTQFGHKLWCDVDVEEPVVEQPKAGPKPVTVEEVKEEHESQMIFPTLDKESPVSSTHEEHVPQSAPSVTNGSEMSDAIEDLESLQLEDDETTDDGFLTDEEYEFLDVESNEEATNGKR